MTVKLVLRYDGGPFEGWQIQAGGLTVQGVLEAALARIFSTPVRVQGAARTDSGVHAFGQVASAVLPADMDLDRLRRALSGMLRPHVRVEAITPAPDDFNARYDARGKTYAYSFQLAREADPFSARYTWCIPWALDLELLARLAASLPGRRDFAGFQCAGSSARTTVRELTAVELKRGPAIGPIDAAAHWRLEYTGGGFLYKMVRNLTGTLIDIARGHFPERHLAELLASPGPYGGYTAPARGLTLMRIFYEEA